MQLYSPFSYCIFHLRIETQQKGNRMMFFTLFLYCVNLEYMLYLHNLFFYVAYSLGSFHHKEDIKQRHIKFNSWFIKSQENREYRQVSTHPSTSVGEITTHI